jgi:formylglycine-generating enzyme required for sulfatase activity
MQYRINDLGLIFFIGLSIMCFDLLSTPSHLWAQSKNQAKIEGRIAVLPISNKSNLKAEEIHFLSNDIQSKVQVKTRGYYQVMTQENILQLLPPDQTLEDCEGACEVETGRLLGAKLVITGELGNFGNKKDNLRLSLKLFETENGTLISSTKIKGSSAEDIEEQINQATEFLIEDGLKILKSQEFDGKLADGKLNSTVNQGKVVNQNQDDLSKQLEALSQLNQKETKAKNIDYDAELESLEAEGKKKEAHQKKIDDEWKQVLTVVDQSNVSIGKQAVQLFMNQYNQHPLGNHRMKEAVSLFDQLTLKEENERKEALANAHLNKVRISYEAAKKYMEEGDEKGKRALLLFLDEFKNHPLGNPLKNEAERFYEERKREQDDRERQKHLRDVENDWLKVKSVVEIGDEKGKIALHLFLKKYEGHALGNPMEREALDFYEDKRLERENRLKSEHRKALEVEWERIRTAVKKGGMSAVKTATKTVALFLEKYEGHVLGNPFEDEARDVLEDLKGGKEIQGEQGEGNERNDGEIIKGKAGIEWVLIRGGSFMIGSSGGYELHEIIRRVNVKDFYMSKTEVTVGQYRKCVDAGVCSEPSCDWKKPNWTNRIADKEKHPINCVDWKQARTFAKWVGGDLPSEAQWEYASRSGGRDIKYPWGNAKATCKYAVMSNYTVKPDGGDGCGRWGTWEVCSKTGGNTTQGLCDMVGNVYEWVLDEYHNSYSGAPSDDIGWCSDRVCDGDTSAPRVLRGGYWGNSNAWTLLSANRSYSSPGHRHGSIGFRVSDLVP